MCVSWEGGRLTFAANIGNTEICSRDSDKIEAVQNREMKSINSTWWLMRYR